MNISVAKLKRIINEEVAWGKKLQLDEKQNPSQMLQTLDDIGGLVKWIGDNMGEPEYGDPMETQERLERLDDLISVLNDSLRELETSDKDGYSKVPGTRPMQEADDLDPRYEDSDEAAHNVNMALEEITKTHEELWGYKEIPRELMETLDTAMETINANWTAMTGLTIDEGGIRSVREHTEEADAQEVHDAWVDVGKFLAKLYNQGQDELAADLDKILTRFQAAGAIPRKAGIKEADEGGPGVHDIMNLPEPEAVESSGNPKEDAIRQIVASSSMAKVDGQKLDLFTASVIVQVLDALGPENKEHYLQMPVAKMADMAFKLTK